MEISQFALARLYLLSILLGVGLGVVYDALRITRVFFGVHYSRRATDRLKAIRLPFLQSKKEQKESPLLGTVIFFEDLFFGIFCGISTILLFYTANNGKFRGLALLCTLGGFFLYRTTVGRVVMLFSEVIAFFTSAAVRYLFFFLFLPFRWIAKHIARAYIHAYGRLSQRVQKEKREKYTRLEQSRAHLACGMLPTSSVKQKGSLKRGYRYGTKGKKAVQPEHTDASVHSGHRHRVIGRVRQ